MGIGAWPTFKRTWQHQTTMQLATLSVLIGSFTVLTVAALIHQNIKGFLNHWGDKVKVNVYLNEDISQTQMGMIDKFLKSSDVFESHKYLSKKDAAENFKKRISKYAPNLVADLESENPIPASFEVLVDGGIQSKHQFDLIVAVADQLKKMQGVEEVSYGQGWVENYAAVLKVFSITSILFVFVLLCGVLFVIGNSIRNSISQRRDEIELLELFGATRGAILWPYIFEGLVMGFISASTAVMFTYLAYAWQVDVVSGELTFWNVNANIEFLNIFRIISLIFIGTALGGLGSYLWARKISTGWAASEAVKQ